MRIGRVVLTVHDLERVSGFYQRSVGLTALEQHRDVALLGAGETVLLELRLDRAARRRSPNEAGLFHTAFLLPTRGDLGRWTRRAMADRTPITGSADHLVSEAIYLDDPEANGVEIYADRPAAGLVWQDGLVLMRNTALDVAGLVAEGGATEWRGAPPGTTVGHVHLQVGALAAAEEFYAETLGFAVTRRAPGATFFASGRYRDKCLEQRRRGSAGRSLDRSDRCRNPRRPEPQIVAGSVGNFDQPGRLAGGTRIILQTLIRDINRRIQWVAAFFSGCSAFPSRSSSCFCCSGTEQATRSPTTAAQRGDPAAPRTAASPDFHVRPSD